jgi:hypothetical protein
MEYAADRRSGMARPRITMRPRRWYNSEIAPADRSGVKLTVRLWRYRALGRRQHMTPSHIRGAASSFESLLHVQHS